jgi:alpha-galactosidase
MDWEITQRHGVHQPYAENGGPGGFAHAARNIPPILAIARGMEQRCPRAPLILLSNPLPRLCRAVAKYTTITPIGLCHQVLHGYRLAGMVLAERLAIALPEGIEQPISHHDPEFRRRPDVVRFNRQVHERLAIKAAGLNHFTWMLDVRDRRTGEDLYPALKEHLLAGPSGHEPLTRDMLRLTGSVPVPGDTHMSEYLPYLHNPVTKPWERYGLYLYPWAMGERNRTALWERIERLTKGGGPDLEELRQAVSEGVFEVVQGLTENTNAYLDALNVPNQGAISHLPGDTIIEAPALVSSMGALPLRIGALPPMVAELCRREAELVELVVDASVQGSRAIALQALALDPVIDDLSIARDVLDDLLETHQAHLPQFHTL